jgi:MFS family permease
LGNGAGPFIGGAVVEGATWSWVFWMVPIMTVPTSMVILFFLPLKHRSGDHLEKMKKIDYGGMLLNIASTLLVLIPLSGGGVTYQWASPFFIACTVTGTVVGILFVLYEWKLVALPIMPLRLYRAPHSWALYLQTFLVGLAYFGNFFYLPIYFQSILGYSPLASGALILPVVITTSFASIASGQYMNRVGRYSHCILMGFALWTLGNGLTLLFDRGASLGRLIVVLIVEGAGIGLTLQPTLVGLYANGRGEDRAVATGLRNFIRTIGGAFGLVISGVILSNTLGQNLTDKVFVSDGLIAQLTSSTYDLDKLGLTQRQQDRVLDVYMLGLHYIFAFYTACIGLGLCLTFWVGNTSLKAPPKEEVIDTGGALDEEAPQTQITLSQGTSEDTIDEKQVRVVGPYVKSDNA